MKQIRDLNFLTFWLSLGNQYFGSNAYVNSICFKNYVVFGHKCDPRHPLRPKKSWLLIKKKFWFRLIWVHFPKIDLWGLFFTQISVPNPGVQSEKRYNEKYRFFQKLRKVPINQLFFQLFCLQISCHYFDITVLTWYDDYNVFKSIRKFLKITKNWF